MSLSKERLGEIAYLVLKERTRKDGMRNLQITNEIWREIGNQTKAINTYAEKSVEATEIKQLLCQLMSEIFSEAQESLEKLGESSDS